jgi:hypothetical protein
MQTVEEKRAKYELKVFQIKGDVDRSEGTERTVRCER